MSVLYVTHAADDGMVAVITDKPCECGWPETILHIYPDDRPTMRGCASCEAEHPETRR